MNKVLSVCLLFFMTLFILTGPPASSIANASPFIGEIRWVAFDFLPPGWAFCNGQLLPIAGNAALYSLLGNRFGGNGSTTFALPDLRGRAPIHVSSSHSLGQKGGEENHTLLIGEIPSHGHSWTSNADPREGDDVSPVNRVPAKTSSGAPAYGSVMTGNMSDNALSLAGGGQSHENMKPFIVMNCIIATEGTYLYPSRPEP